jgi:hypothetical protein
MWQVNDRWYGRLERPFLEVQAADRTRCLRALRRAAGDSPLAVEVVPALVGVAEAAAILGWDKRRVSTYVRRGSFPEPVASLASGRVWRREDVERYAESWRSRRRRTAR